MLKPYPFDYKGNKKNCTPLTRIYAFKDWSNRKFIIEVECHPLNLYAVKFYPWIYRESDDRYRIITNYGQPGRLIGTCLAVIATLYGTNPKASFGIVAINSINEAKEKTRRFRVYSLAIENTVTRRSFLHQTYDEQSLYVLVNREEVERDPNFVQKIETVISPLISEYFKGEDVNEKKVNRYKKQQ